MLSGVFSLERTPYDFLISCGAMSSCKKDSEILGVYRRIDVWDDVIIGVARGDSGSEEIQSESEELGLGINHKIHG